MAIRHGNKTYLQILLDPHRAELLRQVADNKGMRATAWIRDAVYKMLELHVPPEIYKEATSKDEAAWQESVRRRVEGRMKTRKQSEESPGDTDKLG
jgi:hypothetical protein